MSQVLRRGSGLLLIAASGVLLSGPALSGDKIEQVTVEAARIVPVSQSEYLAPIEQMQISRGVVVGDLDLKSAAGQAELDRRLNATASELCKQLDKMMPLEAKTAKSCEKDAVKKAKDQLAKGPAAK
ncbi:MAG TPA: UrcA family protein [Steroidobacteraceae bacterium]|nr:UrcA family protein [Steroidobacteraceae bacterium]